ncbi:MAG: hypothetical protein FJ087_07695 [Deltaproteobacteria bacterium]|nr:hypothetical protein [Deltaproteobacteria bacterium]
MGFDVTRAVVETLGSRTSVLDRIVSYMYFSDLSVVEQSTWDEFGSGESVLGSRPGGDGPGVVLCTALPQARNLPFPDPGATPAQALDLARLVDVLAQVKAVSELDPAALSGPVHLVAYRPDPIGASLRSVLESAGALGGTCLAFAPTGAAPVRVPHGLVVLHADVPSPPRRALRAPAREVVRVAVDGPGETALRLLASLPDAVPGCAVLDVHPAAGSDLAAVTGLEAVLALPDPAASLPPGVSEVGRPSTVAAPGAWTGALGSCLAAIERLRGAVDAAWGAPAPDAVRLLAIDGPASTVALTLAAALPAGAGDRIESLAASIDAQVVHASVPDGPAEPDVPPCDAGLGAALSVAGMFHARLAMGPEPAAALADPGGSARALASSYLSAIREALG